MRQETAIWAESRGTHTDTHAHTWTQIIIRADMLWRAQTLPKYLPNQLSNNRHPPSLHLSCLTLSLCVFVCACAHVYQANYHCEPSHTETKPRHCGAVQGHGRWVISLPLLQHTHTWTLTLTHELLLWKVSEGAAGGLGGCVSPLVLVPRTLYEVKVNSLLLIIDAINHYYYCWSDSSRPRDGMKTFESNH